MKQCKDCKTEIPFEHEYYCYYCGRAVCSSCVKRVDLSLHTQATCCVSCWQEQYVAQANANETRMEIMVNAAFNGHDLSEWQLTESEDGWQATCRKCAGTIWVGKKGLQYSLLTDPCPSSK